MMRTVGMMVVGSLVVEHGYVLCDFVIEYDNGFFFAVSFVEVVAL